MAIEPKKIYDLLRERIIWLDLPPERVLNLSELAASCGVSRTPIKEALILLQAEGWVVRQGSHFAVTPLSLERIKEISEIRFIMEVQANIWAMQRISDAERAALEQLKQEVSNLGPGATNKQIVELDFKIHMTLFRAARNHFLSQQLEWLLSHSLRFCLSINREFDPESFLSETLEIMQAVLDRDEARLRRASLRHIEVSVDTIRSYF